MTFWQIIDNWNMVEKHPTTMCYLNHCRVDFVKKQTKILTFSTALNNWDSPNSWNPYLGETMTHLSTPWSPGMWRYAVNCNSIIPKYSGFGTITAKFLTNNRKSIFRVTCQGLDIFHMFKWWYIFHNHFLVLNAILTSPGREQIMRR